MKCIWLTQAIFIWIIICFSVMMFVPDKYDWAQDNIGWISGILITIWWLSGYINRCN